MPNGKTTTRDYVVEMHTDLKYIRDWIKEHDKKHAKWFWFIITGCCLPVLLMLIRFVVWG